MTKRPSEARSPDRLRVSPNFTLTIALNGRSYVAKDSEPYTQYWLTEQYRVLLSLFSGRRGTTETEAIDAYYRLAQIVETAVNRRALRRAIRDMRGAGVLIGIQDDASRYDAAIVADYVKYRPFPKDISDRIIRDGGIGPDSAVLDLAGGPGDLALALARVSAAVSMMELSSAFVKAARTRAMRLGLKLTTLHESCNRLAWLDGEYDVITVSQALHWLDDVLVCRGICRLLRPGGSFFVIHAAFDVPASHPLDFLLGRHSVLGDKVDQPFTDEVQALVRRLSLLFEALDAPDVDRANLGRQAVRGGDTAAPRIALDSISLFRQERPMGMGFARAFLTSRHIEVSGRKPGEFWLDLEARCTAATPAQLAGTFNWALLHFRRGTNHPAAPPVGSVPVTEIGYEGPSETRGSLPRFFRKHSAG